VVLINEERNVFSLDRVIEELTLRFQQTQELAEKYAFLTPLNPLDDKYKCQIDHDHDDFDKEEWLIERERLQHLIAVADIEEGIKMRKASPLELLQFIRKNNRIKLCNIFIPTRKALDFKHASQ